MASGTSPPGRARLLLMCGIAGIVGPLANAEIAENMSRLLRHRGPDGSGVWCQPGVALSHRRLAIQDLTEAGHQPMLFGPHVLTYNGELYNHEHLRAALPGPWASSGDTEVLLRLLATQGRAALRRVIGMFAFAVGTMFPDACCSPATGLASNRCTTACSRTVWRSHRSSRRS